MRLGSVGALELSCILAKFAFASSASRLAASRCRSSVRSLIRRRLTWAASAFSWSRRRCVAANLAW